MKGKVLPKILRTKGVPNASQPVEKLGSMRLAFDTFDRLGIDCGREEYLAVLDEAGNPTGEAVSRKEAHKQGILHGAVHIYIYRKCGESVQLLLQRRSHNKDSFPDCLDISSAGHMEVGMSFGETAAKELEEELGLPLTPDNLTPVLRRRFSGITEQHGKTFNDQEINEIYLLRIDGLDLQILTLQKEEVSEVLWMDLDTIADRLDQKDGELCIDREEFLEVAAAIREQKMNDE